MALHGEQYLAIHAESIPTEGTLVNQAQIAEVLDKGERLTFSLGLAKHF
jgi:hypothetical protein